MTISPLAIVSPEAVLGDDIEIGAFTIVHGGVRIGTGSRIGSHCEIGLPTPLAAGESLTIGDGALIRSHTVLYAGSNFGARLETGHHVTVRERTRAADGLRLGTGCDIQGDCSFGPYARLHSNVFVPKGCRVGRCAWLMPGVMLTNDPTPPSEITLGCTVGDFAVVCAAALLLPGVSVGARAVVAAKACVRDDVAEGLLVAGVPARVIGPANRVRLRPPLDGPAYPWTSHFGRGYPPGALDP